MPLSFLSFVALCYELVSRVRVTVEKFWSFFSHFYRGREVRNIFEIAYKVFAGNPVFIRVPLRLSHQEHILVGSRQENIQALQELIEVLSRPLSRPAAQAFQRICAGAEGFALNSHHTIGIGIICDLIQGYIFEKASHQRRY